MSDGSIQNEYYIYTEEQMNGFVEDGIIHETIRENIRGRNTQALCDLIIYTDTYDPDILDDAIRELPNEDKLWFITNREVIITMYPDTYTNMLSNWRVSLPDTLCPQRLLAAFTELLNPDAPDYELVTQVWLHVANFEEIIDILSELNPKNVLAANADGQLFEFLVLMLNTKSRLIANLPDGELTNIIYTPIFQSYLDLLGNYIRPFPNRTNPKIVMAYDAICNYLQDQKCGISVNIMLVNQFHDEDIQIFKDICDVLARFPPAITLTTNFGYGVLLECVRFDLADELATMLTRYDITLDSLREDPYDYKLIAKLLFIAIQPSQRQDIVSEFEPRPRCLEFLQTAGYLSGYQEWFRGARYEELEIISGCDWPLVAFSSDIQGKQGKQGKQNDTIGTGSLAQYLSTGSLAQALGTDDDTQILHPPRVGLEFNVNGTFGIRFQDYQGVGLILQFLRMTDLTNTGQIQTELTDHIMSVWHKQQLQPFSDAESALTTELTKYLRGRQYVHNPNMVKNKLYQLRALLSSGFISQSTYTTLEQEVFIRYLLDLTHAKYSTMKIAELFMEFKPVYSFHYWTAIILSELIASGLESPAEFNNTIKALLKQYSELLTINKPSPDDYIAIMATKDFQPRCSPASIICKSAAIIKFFYPTGDSDGTVNSTEILEHLADIRFNNNVDIHVLLIISIYSKQTRFEFQLSKLLIEKLMSEISNIAGFCLDRLVLNSVFANYCYILSRHTDLAIGRQIIHTFLNELFMNNTNCSSGQIINPFKYEEETPEIIGYMRLALTDSDFILLDKEHDSRNRFVIKPTEEYVKKQEISRRRNWCASRQIQLAQCKQIDICGSEMPSGGGFICPISFEPLFKGDHVIRLLGCKHIFGADSIIRWCNEQDTCPFCRASLADGKLSGANCEMFELV